MTISRMPALLTRTRRSLQAAAAAGLVLLAGCTEARLQAVPPTPPVPVDDLLSIEGEFCTAPPDAVTFPVKILFLLDQSASLQCTDSENRRFGALRTVVDELLPLPNVSLGFVGFSSWSRQQTFTRNRDDIAPFLDPAGGLGPATDYQGALATASRMLEQDMVAAGPAERARTRYVVVFMSDGSAEPRCRAGCEDDFRACANNNDDDGDGLTDAADPDCADIDDRSLRPDSLYGVCNTRQEIPDGVYVDMQGVCPAYNQPDQIRQRIADVLALRDAYSVGDIQLNTVLLFSPQDVVEGVCPGAGAQFGYDEDQARAGLLGMAQAGGGTFRDVNLEQEDDTFLTFDFTSLERPYILTGLSAENVHARRTGGERQIDRDGDGLVDTLELELGTDPLRADSDRAADGSNAADGYSDLFEHVFSTSGFDAKSADRPAIVCGATDDRDGDGLRDCEEAFLKSSPVLADTDGDLILDRVELAVGTDPLVPDSLRDLDFDGRTNLEEVRAGTDPRVPDDEAFRRERVRYRLDELGERYIPDPDTGEPSRRSCYAYEANDVRLVVTPFVEQRGLNRVLVRTIEQPLGGNAAEAVHKVACVEVFYQGETRKDPPSGRVRLTDDAFAEARAGVLRELEPIASCVQPDPEQSATRGEVVAAAESCTPRRVQLAQTLYERDELVALLNKYLRGNLEVRLPERASDVFVPLASFDADQHCSRAWEVSVVRAYLALLAERCAPCLEKQRAEAEATP